MDDIRGVRVDQRQEDLGDVGFAIQVGTLVMCNLGPDGWKLGQRHCPALS